MIPGDLLASALSSTCDMRRWREVVGAAVFDSLFVVFDSDAPRNAILFATLRQDVNTGSGPRCLILNVRRSPVAASIGNR